MRNLKHLCVTFVYFSLYLFITITAYYVSIKLNAGFFRLHTFLLGYSHFCHFVWFIYPWLHPMKYHHFQSKAKQSEEVLLSLHVYLKWPVINKKKSPHSYSSLVTLTFNVASHQCCSTLINVADVAHPAQYESALFAKCRYTFMPFLCKRWHKLTITYRQTVDSLSCWGLLLQCCRPYTGTSLHPGNGPDCL